MLIAGSLSKTQKSSAIRNEVFARNFRDACQDLGVSSVKVRKLQNFPPNLTSSICFVSDKGPFTTDRSVEFRSKLSSPEVLAADTNLTEIVPEINLATPGHKTEDVSRFEIVLFCYSSLRLKLRTMVAVTSTFLRQKNVLLWIACCGPPARVFSAR